MLSTGTPTLPYKTTLPDTPEQLTEQLSPELFGNRTIIGIASDGSSNGSFFALCDDGSVLSWGDNSCGQLGHGNTETYKSPTQINPDHFDGRKIVKVKTHAFYAIYIADDGTVFSSGNNNCGQLGQGHTTNCHIPMQIDPNCFGGRKVIDAIVNHSHTVFRCNDDSIFTCGWNEDGQLGLGHTKDTNIPQQISPSYFEGGKIIDIAIGNTHTVFRCDNGIFVCGDNSHGKIGQGKEVHFCAVPTPLPLTQSQGIMSSEIATHPDQEKLAEQLIVVQRQLAALPTAINFTPSETSNSAEVMLIRILPSPLTDTAKYQSAKDEFQRFYTQSFVNSRVTQLSITAGPADDLSIGFSPFPLSEFSVTVSKKEVYITFQASMVDQGALEKIFDGLNRVLGNAVIAKAIMADSTLTIKTHNPGQAEKLETFLIDVGLTHPQSSLVKLA